jgi:hypothetical protein
MRSDNPLLKPSVMFAVVTIVASAACLVGSIFSGFYHKPFAEELLSHLAILGVTAFVAAVFFSLRDVRELISGSIANLIIDGEIVKYLSADSRAALRLKTVEQDLSTDLSSLRRDLWDAEFSKLTSAMKMPHIFGYNVLVKLCDDGVGLIRSEVNYTYRISCEHLRDGKGTVPIKVRQEYADPECTLNEQALLSRFELQVNGKNTPIKPEVTRTRHDGTSIVMVTLDHLVDVNNEASIHLKTVAVSTSSDNTEVVEVHYPTRGFTAMLSYREDMHYDVAWMLGEDSDVPASRGQVETFMGGISAITQEWIMPGSGVILYWFKPETDRQPESALVSD